MKWFTPFRICALCLALLLVAAYSNHFHNSFHFDDEHTIVNNIYVRNLGYFPQYFKSAATFSSLPMNQTYRPMLTALYALAYHFNGTADTFYFHLFVFLFYIGTGILLYLIIVKLFEQVQPGGRANCYFALFATGWYMLNTANADVVNYLSSASDSVSTFWVVAAMALYIYKPLWRKYMLYLIPVAIGVLFKQSALAFAGLLAAYYFFFESGAGKFLQRAGKTIVATLPSLILCLGLYELQAKLTSATYITGGKPFNYIITQPFVMLHYFANFFFATGLTADSDWVPFASVADYRFWLGILFLAALAWVVIKLITRPRYAPVGFGLLWFFLALVPSSLEPLSEVMNDFRPFFAYPGLAIAAGWLVYLAWQKWLASSAQNMRLGILALAGILLGNTVGTYARNRVWKTDESLWYDVTLKSPENGRGLMNYGLTQMNKGNYPVAEEYFTRGLKLLPEYSYLYANMGVLLQAEKRNDEADTYFKKAIMYGQGIPVIYYFYAKFLHQQGRDKEALDYVLQAIRMSPADVYSRYLAMDIYQSLDDFKDMAKMAKQTLVYVPGDKYAQTLLAAASGMKTKLEEDIEQAKQNPTPENYLNLSLEYYNKKNYQGCIDAAKQALKLKPDYALAYNNIGSAYNAMGDWAQAEQALKQALKIQPGFSLAQNNYVLAVKAQAVTDSMNAVIKQHPTAENYISLSLIYYGQGLYLKSVDACKQALKINPADVTAYNNMCAAYNNLEMWDDAIAAGQKAVQLAPGNQLAKNNLATAQQGKANAGN